MNSSSVLYYEFDEFRFDPKGRLLLRNGVLVDVTPKALEILWVLLESGGRAVSKEEIIDRVWHDSFVEEANLSYTVYKLRRALCEDESRKFVETLPKRGYRFAADVSEIFDATDPPLREHTEVISKKSNRVVFASVAVFVILGLAVSGFFWLRPDRRSSVSAKDNQLAAPEVMSQITTSGKYACGAISPDGQYITYAQNSDFGSGELFVRRVGSPSDTALLGPGARIFGELEFSPDSRSIFYVVANEIDSKWQLYRIAVGGGPPVLQLSIDDNMFSISPDGMSVYYYRSDNQLKTTDIIEAKLDGSGSTVVYTRLYAEMIFQGVPSISPDGGRIAFGADDNAPVDKNATRRLSLFVLDLKTGGVQRMTGETWRGVGIISWLHDRSGLVFAAGRKPNGNQLFYMSLASGEVRQITKEFGIFGNFGASISDDGQTLMGARTEAAAKLWQIDATGKRDSAVQVTNGEADGSWGVAAAADGAIVYSARFGDDLDLWLMTDRNGRKEGKPLTSDAYFDGEPAVSPDGNGIVFVSDRAGIKHLFAIKPDGTGLTQLTFGDSLDENPDFSPDGKWIFYSSKNDEMWRIRKIPSAGGDPLQVTDFESLAPSISPDGTMIACVSPKDGVLQSSDLTIVSANDGQLVKQFSVLTFEYHYSQPRWTADGKTLVYQTHVNDTTNLWRQDLAGGEPSRMTDFKSTPMQMSYFSYTRDWRHLVASRLEYKTNVVLIKNFKPERSAN